MKYIRIVALLLAACLLLSTGALAADSIGTPRDSLRGKTLLILGDSYCAGYGLSDMSQNWPTLLAESMDMTLYNWSISGSTFASGILSKEPMVERCQYLTPDQEVDIVILQGGSNDHTRSVPLGAPDSRDPETCLGALNLILDHLTETYPQADILVFTPWANSGPANSLGLYQQDYTAGILSTCDTRDVLCYNAADSAENGIYFEYETFRRYFSLSLWDRYHLNEAGQRRFASAFARWLSDALYESTPADAFVDLVAAPEKVREGVSVLAPTGLFTGDTGIFSPYTAVTRREFAEILYRLADCPPAYDYTFTDVSPEDPGYDAICYCLDAGIFYPTDTFWPEYLLSRQTAALALYNCYTQIYGGELTRYASTGSYNDGSEVESYAKIPLGWAIQEDIVSGKSGYLYPKSPISRGDLAVALTAFLRLVGEIP